MTIFSVSQSYDDGFGLNPGLEAHGEVNLQKTFLSVQDHRLF